MSSHERSWDCTEHILREVLWRYWGTTKVKKTNSSLKGLVRDIKVRILILWEGIDIEFS